MSFEFLAGEIAEKYQNDNGERCVRYNRNKILSYESASGISGSDGYRQFRNKSRQKIFAERVSDKPQQVIRHFRRNG